MMRIPLAAHATANEVRLLREVHKGAIVIVEGGSDSRVYKHLLHASKCTFVVADGKDNAVDALSILEQTGFKGVLAVVDSDFWQLDGITSDSENVFLTDAHDLETMILDSPALSKVLDQFASAEKVTSVRQWRGKRAFELLLESGKCIGYFRWYAHRKGLSLKFDGLSYNSFVSSTDLSVDENTLVAEVKNNSRRYGLDDQQTLRDFNDLKDNCHDLRHVCCGDDLISILSIALRRLFGSRTAADVRPQLLRKILHIAYELHFFATTELYSSLRHWQEKHAPYVVLNQQ